jgi:DNA-binding MarR family transcriptional regulator
MATRQHAVKSESRPPTARTPAGDALGAVAIRVLRLAGPLTAAGDALARPAGQTSARWQLLAALENAPATVADVARMLGLARQSVQRVADVLAGEGLIGYDDNPDHARAKLARLAPRGRAALAAIQTAQRAWANRLGAEIGEAELRRALPALDRLLAALARRPGEDND